MLPVAVLNTMTNSDSEWGRGCVASRALPITKGSQQELEEGTCKRELKQRPQRNVARWLLSRLSLSHTSYTLQASLLGDSAARKELDPLHHLAMEKRPRQANLMEAVH